MHTAMRRRVLRHLRAQRFDRVVDVLSDVYADASDDRSAPPSTPHAGAGCWTLTCGGCARPRPTSTPIAREVADILGHLDLAGAAQRWWQRTRSLTRAPPAPVDVAIDTPDRHPRHLAAFGLGRFEVLVGEPVTRWRSMRAGRAQGAARAPGRAVHREELMEALWPGAPTTGRGTG